MFLSKRVVISMMAVLLLGSGCTENTTIPLPKDVVRITPLPTNTSTPSAPSAPSTPSTRLALVIGNGNYKPKQAFIGKLPFQKLDNPVNDAVDMAKVLDGLGFDVILKTDVANRAAMKQAVREFRQRLPKDGRAVGLFYFSGHGFQHNNTNYLVPLRARMSSDIDIEDEAFNTDYVLRHLEKFNPNGVNLVVLDACRDSIPEDFFEDRANKGSFSDQLKAGFTQLQAPAGSLIAYSTAPNTTSWGGLPGERNSVYTKHLLTALQTQPRLNVTHLLMTVRKGVIDETQDETEPQAPWDSVSLTAPFCFKEPCGSSGESVSPQQLAELEKQRLENERLRQRLAIQDREKIEREAQLLRERQEKQRLLEQLAEQERPEPPQPTPSPSNVFRDSLKRGGYGPEMVWIPAGRFKMGDIQGGGDSHERPVHSVSVKKFAMGKSELTVGEFRQFVNATGYRTDAEKEGSCYVYSNGIWSSVSGTNWRNPGNISQTDKHPVVCVSWNDATAYMEWLSQQTGHQYRLPTEAQWEYAARAGTETKYWWGNDIGTNKANCYNCGSRWDGKSTAPVGSFDANPFGLYDTAGNVWEWTCSEYEDKYAGKEQRCANGAGLFVVRSGSWFSNAGRARSAYRNRDVPTVRYVNYGVRPARIK